VLCLPLVENYWGQNRGRPVRMGGDWEEVWTTDKEARGRAERKTEVQGYCDRE